MRKTCLMCLSVCICLVVLLSCSLKRVYREQFLPDQIKTVEPSEGFLKAHMKSGYLYIFSEWEVVDQETAVTGSGSYYDLNRALVKEGTFTIPFDSVAIFETNRLQPSPSLAALSLMTGISISLTIVCIASPKTCFGSCPTFYTAVDNREQLVAEGFSSSVSPSLERTDVDALFNVRPASSRLTFTMKNEALETHAVRSVNLLAVPRKSDRILYGHDHRFYRTGEWYAVQSCLSGNSDYTEKVYRFDHDELVTLADSTYLGRKDTLTVLYEQLPQGKTGFTVAARHSLLSTYLFYQTLAYMGTTAGQWLAALERSNPELTSDIANLGGVLGGLELYAVNRNDSLLYLGSLQETGPLATELHTLVVDSLPGDIKSIKIVHTLGHWRIDYLAVAGLTETVEPVRLYPAQAVKLNGDNPNCLSLLMDSSAYLITYPGDNYEFSYELPEKYHEYEYFLEATGYYLEWMRDEWLDEEDQAKVLMMLYTPEKALEYLAKDYKIVEKDMEEYFWNSKYAK